MRLMSRVVFFLLLCCCLRDVKSQDVTSTLTVKNGDKYGEWGEMEFCRSGKAKGFYVKVQPDQGWKHDDTALNGIRLICTDGSFIQSAVGRFGTSSRAYLCPSGFLTSFSLRVHSIIFSLDHRGATNIKFKCTDGSILEGNGPNRGSYDQWSESCKEGGICGILTKVDNDKKKGSLRGLTDVKFYCCS